MEHAPEPSSNKEESDDEDDTNGETGEDLDSGEFPNDETRLLGSDRRASVVPVSFFPSKPRESIPAKSTIILDRKPSLVAKRRWRKLSDRTRWWLLFAYDFLNAPVIGAILGAIIGLIPALHVAFFSDSQDGGIFTAWLTASLKNIGGLFVPLPVVVAGVSLYTAMQKSKSEGHTEEAGTPWSATIFVLVIRFVVWPVASITVIYFFAKNTGFLGTDPMLWFALMLMPTGPPAMKLITLVEVSDASEADEHKIARLLTISYIISPILAFTVVASLRASQSLIV